jgi:hypothetical protein
MDTQSVAGNYTFPQGDRYAPRFEQRVESKKGGGMPTISMFYGIVICLYFFDDERHKLPHIHAKYQGSEASFSILDGSVLSGDIPLTKMRLVQAWIEIHRESLLADWELAVNGQTPFAIEPLR